MGVWSANCQVASMIYHLLCILQLFLTLPNPCYVLPALCIIILPLGWCPMLELLSLSVETKSFKLF